MTAGRHSAHAAALVLALMAAPLGAQTTIGVRVGLGSAALSGDEATQGGQVFDDPRGGIVAGVDAGFPLSGGLGVRLGMGLAQKGGPVEVPSSITASRALTEPTAEMDYLQFSALLRAGSAAEGGSLSFGLLAGPFVALNVSCQVAVAAVDPGEILPEPPPGIPSRVSASRAGWTSSAQATNIACGEGGVSAVKSTDFGLVVGGGFEVSLTESTGLAFDLIYARGLTEIDDEGRKTGHVSFQGGLVFAIG